MYWKAKGFYVESNSGEMLVNTSVSAHYKIEKQIGTVVGQCKIHLYYKLLTQTIREGWRQISLQVSHPVPHD